LTPPAWRCARKRRKCAAYAEEVDAALEEGIQLETLVSPVKIRYIEAAEKEGVHVETMVEPVKILSQNGRLVGIDCIRNTLGEIDASGRGRPVPIPGTEFRIPLNTLIVAIGERPASEGLVEMGVNLDKSGRVVVDPKTLCTSRPGVFAGGDLVTGPNTVVDAIAAGKAAAGVIDRYLRGVELSEPARCTLPGVYLEPAAPATDGGQELKRAEPSALPAETRKKNFAEVEMSLTEAAALREARRCLRCDLQFTCRDRSEPAACVAAEREQV